MSTVKAVKVVLKKGINTTLKYANQLIKLEPVSVTSDSFEDLVKKANTVYTISSSYDLQGKTVTLPANVTLIFRSGGKVSNGKLIGNNTYIDAGYKIFYNVSIEGTWKTPGNVGWFANGTSNISNPIDEADGLQKALDSSFTELVFPPEKFYTASTLILSSPKRLIMHGIKLRWPLSWNPTVQNTSVLFTDKNIDLLLIDIKDGKKSNTTEIIGGNFDVSKARDYTASAIKVIANDNQKLWGLTINTNIIGNYNSETGIGIDLNPVEMTDDKPVNSTYITNVRIDSDISYMGTGIKAVQWGNKKNWLTDVCIDGNIRFCPTAIDTSADCTVTASLQAGKFWNERQNEKALVYVRGGDTIVAIGSTVYDIYQAADEDNDIGPYSNRYAVVVEDNSNGDLSSSTVVPFGKFEAFLIGSTYHNVSMIKGRMKSPVTKDCYYNGGMAVEKSANVIMYGNELFNKV